MLVVFAYELEGEVGVKATAKGIFGGVNACVCGDVKQMMFGE